MTDGTPMAAAVLIANAGAGSSDQRSIQSAVERLEHDGCVVEVATTRSTGELDDVLGRRGDREVIVAGGDGSLHAVVGALARRGDLAGTIVGLIPLGTGNDFARSLGVPLEPVAAAAALARGVPQPIDLLVTDDGEVVVNAVNLGIGADASRRAASLKRWVGRAAYGVGALAVGFTARGRHLEVEVDGEPLADGSRRVLQIGIGNGQFVGGGTALTPTAHPADGKVDVVVSYAVGIGRFAYALQVMRRTHMERHDVAWARATRVEVRGEDFWCSSDGELSGPHRKRSWTVQRGALTMRLPEGSDLGA